MYRIKIESSFPTQYRWYNDPRQAHIVAYTIVKNKDADIVTVENLKEKKIEKIYKRAWQIIKLKKGDKTMKNQKFLVRYKTIIDGVISSEICRPKELKYFLLDEKNGEIQILEIDQTFNDWETMEVFFKK